ncbi:MAG: hypothetical protein H0W12_03460, partial [Chitinophagaceae bacterium]|nr:hypothetical protein [Chitinophagaceae bacterium]
MNTISDDFETPALVRPVFLKVLCILTFVGSSFAIFNNGYSYITADKAAAVLDSSKTRLQTNNDKRDQNNPGHKFAVRMFSTLSASMTPENIREIAIGNVIASAICLIGALFMWKLRRYGWYIYILGVAAGVAVPFLIIGNNFISVASSAFTGFFGLLFIVLYGLNI